MNDDLDFGNPAEVSLFYSDLRTFVLFIFALWFAIRYLKAARKLHRTGKEFRPSWYDGWLFKNRVVTVRFLLISGLICAAFPLYIVLTGILHVMRTL